MTGVLAMRSLILIWGIVIALSVPLALGRVRPNSIYGFRTSKTLSQPAVWYAANRFAGKAFMFTGMVVLSLSLILLILLHRGILPPSLAVTAAMVLEFAPLAFALIMSFRHLKQL